jgi:hypothetical protein
MSAPSGWVPSTGYSLQPPWAPAHRAGCEVALALAYVKEAWSAYEADELEEAVGSLPLELWAAREINTRLSTNRSQHPCLPRWPAVI